MREKLTVFIERLKTNPNISSHNEAETTEKICGYKPDNDIVKKLQL